LVCGVSFAPHCLQQAILAREIDAGRDRLGRVPRHVTRTDDVVGERKRFAAAFEQRGLVLAPGRQDMFERTFTEGFLDLILGRDEFVLGRPLPADFHLVLEAAPVLAVPNLRTDASEQDVQRGARDDPNAAAIVAAVDRPVGVLFVDQFDLHRSSLSSSGVL
jgi:hypothetical protein